MQSNAKTVAEYLKSLPADRAKVIRAVRKSINECIPVGYKEVMRWGMITWEIPLSIYPITYNKAPLSYVALAAQKNSYSLYLMGCYGVEKDRIAFEAAYRKTGKRLDIGKSCVRFKSLDDLPIELIQKFVAKYSIEDYIKIYERSRKKN